MSAVAIETPRAQKTRRAIRSRRIIHSGSIVRVYVPASAETGFGNPEMQKIPFLKFWVRVEGGVINLFVHTTADLRGKTINASIEIVGKEFDTGDKYMNVDLHPASELPTHYFRVISGIDANFGARDWDVFETSGKVKAMIILAPIETTRVVDGEMVSLLEPSKKAEKQEPKAVEKPAVKPVEHQKESKPSTGYSGLDRMLRQGWKINGQDAKGVFLYKSEGSRRRTTIYGKPKSMDRVKTMQY